MRTLFAISMLCFFSLLAAVLALVRKVVQSQRLLARRGLEPRETGRTRTHLQPHLFEDTDSPPYGQSSLQHSITGRVAFSELTLRPAPEQSVQDLAPGKSPDWRFMVHSGDEPLRDGNSTIDPARPKGPQATHFGTHERSDWAYFNKDLGDLSDPYEPPRFTGTSNPRPGTNRQAR